MLSIQPMKFQAILLSSALVVLPVLLLGQKTNPTPMDIISPVYPDSLIETGKDGVAKVTFTVNKKGLVEDPVLAEASEPEFGAAALTAIRDWRFKPAMTDGKPVSRRVSLPFKFTASPENKINARFGRKVFQLMEGHIVRTRDLDRQPVAIKKTRAPYPPELAGTGLDERVAVNVTIGPDGAVYNPTVHHIERPVFLVPALIGAAGFEFEPPRRDGHPVACDFEITIWVYEGETPPGRGETGRRPLPDGS